MYQDRLYSFCTSLFFVCDFVITPCSSVYMYFSLQDGETALMKASSGGHVECTKLLLNKDVEVDIRDVVSAMLKLIIVCSNGMFHGNL